MFGRKKDDENIASEKKSYWGLLNLLVVIIAFLGMFFTVTIVRISSTLTMYCISFSVTTALLHRVYKKNGGSTLLLNVARVLNIGTFVLIMGLPFVLFNFNESKSAYQLKKYIFFRGCFSSNSVSEHFPDKLPDSCDNYRFTTVGSMPAPEHRANCCLIFTADSSCIDSYIAHFRTSPDFEEITPVMPKGTAEEQEDMLYTYWNHYDREDGVVYPLHFANYYKLPDELKAELRQPEDYKETVIFKRSGSSYVFDRRTGLAMFNIN